MSTIANASNSETIDLNELDLRVSLLEEAAAEGCYLDERVALLEVAAPEERAPELGRAHWQVTPQRPHWRFQLPGLCVLCGAGGQLETFVDHVGCVQSLRCTDSAGCFERRASRVNIAPLAARVGPARSVTAWGHRRAAA